MKYTREERLNIGRRIRDGEMSRYQAAEKYGINEQTALDYMRLYWDVNKLVPKQGKSAVTTTSATETSDAMSERYENMAAMSNEAGTAYVR